MTEDQEDQLVLDAAWDWLKSKLKWFDRRGLVGGERVAQLWRWNGQRGPLEDKP